MDILLQTAQTAPFDGGTFLTNLGIIAAGIASIVAFVISTINKTKTDKTATQTDSQETKIAVLTVSLKELQTQLVESKLSVVTATGLNETLLARIALLNEKIEGLEKTVLAGNELNKGLVAQMEGQNSVISELKAKIEQLEATITKLIGEKEKAEDELKEEKEK